MEEGWRFQSPVTCTRHRSTYEVNPNLDYVRKKQDKQVAISNHPSVWQEGRGAKTAEMLTASPAVLELPWSTHLQ